ncbi:hypothetical protein BGX38DRAFT_1209791 [Terfezia claveryi]|nr:hypothetical protein BGX38DRAFT_1209791 [Terfezia claveryi]
MLGSNQNAFEVLSNEDGMSSDPDITVTGEDAEEVETENFGFLALNGDVKVKLFPDTFPESSIPISSASLFTIASKKGVFAAAGPSTFILGTTESLRKAFTAAPAGSTKVNYNPTLSLPLPTPISHIVFNSSEEYLILGASSGGVAVYSTQSLGSPNNQAKPLFEVGTHGLALREIKPNPSDVIAELIAVVTQNGDLRIMKLGQQAFVPGKSGEVLKTRISTVAWSQRGKQIICGLTDGSCAQLTPDGDERATIPRPPGLTDHYVSHVTWLENNLFLIGLTPIPSNPREPNNDSIFYIFSRTSNTEGFRFQKLPDPTPPFGMTSRQAYFFCGEIKHWHPHLQDALVLANTSSADIGLITRFTAAINNVPEGTFTVTTIANDSRRAALPLGDQDMTDTSPIGVALDLSSRENVPRPITGEEPEETGPLPIFMVLNNESLVSAWHIVYDDAVRNNCEYSQLAVVKEKQAPYVQPEAKVSAFNTGTGSKIGGDIKPFAAPGIAPAFGQPTLPAKPTFGQLAFGRPAFEQQAAVGQSGWGAAPSTPTASSAPEFGTSSFGSTAPPSIGGTTLPSSSGFGKFASAGSFASMAASTTAGSGPAWAKGLGSNTTSSSTFGGLGPLNDSRSSFGGLQRSGSEGAFGSAAVPLKIHSTFQADKAGDMSSTPDNQGGLFGGFGPSLGGALGVDSTLSVPDADMDAESPMVATPVDKEEDMQSTPSEPSTPPQVRPAAPGAPKPGLFGDFRASKPAPAFASTAVTTTAPKSPPPAPLPPSPVAERKSTPESPPVPLDAPLPPGSVSKTTKEEIPDLPLPQMHGDKFKDDQSKIEDKEVPKNVFLQKPSLGPFSSAAGEKNPFVNTAAFGKPSITSSPLSWTSEGSLLGTSAPSSTVGKPTPLAPAFSSSIKAPTPGLFSQPKPDSPAGSPTPADKPALSSSPSTAPPKSPLGVSDGMPAPESLSAPLQSAFATTTQPLPPLDEGSLLSTSPAVRKDTKAGGSVFDSPPAELTGGIFAGLSKKKPVKSDRVDKTEIKQALSSRISVTPATKSTLGKKPEVGKKLDLGRAKTTLVNRMHRFGTGKSMKPSPLSRRALEDEDEDKDEEDLEEEDEVEEEGEGDNDEDYEEIESEVDEPEEEEEDEEKPASKAAIGDLKLKKPKSAFGDTKPTSAIGNLKQESASVLGHKVPAQLLPKPAASTPEQELAPRVTTPAPPAPPPEYEDERIRNILHSEIPVEPNPATPVFAQNDKIVEASPDDSFEAIYDKAYESCNVMVNSIGLLARNMEAYVSAHSKAPDELKHIRYRPVHQLTEVDEWRLSELAYVGLMMSKARHVHEIIVNGGEVLNESINDLTKGILRCKCVTHPGVQRVILNSLLVQTKASELARLERVVTDPKGAAAAQAHYLPPEQALQQRELRNKLATVQYQLEEAEKSVTMLKAHVVARDRGKSGGRVKPPTVEAVRNTILKLMTLVERKNSDVEYLGELLRRLKAKQAFGGGSMYEESSFMRTTMMAIGTPAREKARAVENVGAEGSRAALRMGLHSDELELEEVKEEITARRQMGDKLRKAMKLVGTRVTNVA